MGAVLTYPTKRRAGYPQPDGRSYAKAVKAARLAGIVTPITAAKNFGLGRKAREEAAKRTAIYDEGGLRRDGTFAVLAAVLMSLPPEQQARAFRAVRALHDYDPGPSALAAMTLIRTVCPHAEDGE